MGQEITGRHIKIVEMPRTMLPTGAINDPSELIGKIALQKVLAGEYLRIERFADHHEGSALAAIIGKKMRAISIRVNDVVGVAGFLLPGNHVDVVASRKVGRRAHTETILEHVRVLAVDQTSTTDKNEPVVVRAVTLEMTPAQTEIMVKGQEEGSIKLTLRNPADDNVLETLPIAEPPPILVAAAAVPRQRARSTMSTITVIRGTSVKTTRTKN